MRRIKCLVKSIFFLFAVSVNVVLAQEINTNGEIYGLEVILGKDASLNFSFFSTYNKREIQTVVESFFVNPEDTERLFAFAHYCSAGVCDDGGYAAGSIMFEDINNNVYKVIVQNVHIPENFKVSKLQVHLEGKYSTVPPLNSSGLEPDIWRSNSLIFRKQLE